MNSNNSNSSCGPSSWRLFDICHKFFHWPLPMPAGVHQSENVESIPVRSPRKSGSGCTMAEWKWKFAYVPESFQLRDASSHSVQGIPRQRLVSAVPLRSSGNLGLNAPSMKTPASSIE